MVPRIVRNNLYMIYPTCNIPVWDNNTIDADLKLKAFTQDCLVFPFLPSNLRLRFLGFGTSRKLEVVHAIILQQQDQACILLCDWAIRHGLSHLCSHLQMITWIWWTCSVLCERNCGDPSSYTTADCVAQVWGEVRCGPKCVNSNNILTKEINY